MDGILIAVDDENDVVCSVVVVIAAVVLTVEDICCVVGTPVSSTFIQSITAKIQLNVCINVTLETDFNTG